MYRLLLIGIIIVNVVHTENGDARIFGLFNVVRFPNDVCSSAGDLGISDDGICLSSSECRSKSGTRLGTCAAGFGTCCLIAASTCGSTVSDNCTYVRNPGYPSSYDGSSACSFVIQQISSTICFIRLDFSAFSTRPPKSHVTDEDGDCQDKLT